MFGPDLRMKHYLDDGLICTLWFCSQVVAAPHLFELPAIVGCTFPSRYVYMLMRLIYHVMEHNYYVNRRNSRKQSFEWWTNLIWYYCTTLWTEISPYEKKMACVNRQLSTTSSLTENCGPNMAMPLQAEDFPSVLKNIKAHMLLRHLNK